MRIQAMVLGLSYLGTLAAAPVVENGTDPVVTWNQRGVEAQAAGHLQQANDAFRKAATACVEIPQGGWKTLECARVWNNLGSLLFQRGILTESKALIQRALDTWRSAGNRDDQSTALGNLAAVERARGEFPESLGHYQAALELRVQLYGHNDSRTLATVDGMAILAYESGDYQQGETLARRELSAIETDAESSELARARMALALNLHGQGRLTDAISFMEQVAAMRERLLGPGHTLVAETWNALGLAYRRQARLAEAESAYKRAAAIFQAAGCDGILARIWNNLAQVMPAERSREAQQFYDQAIANLEANGPVSPALSAIYSNYTAFLLRLHAFDKARLVAMKTLVIDRENGSAAFRISFDLGRLGLAAYGLKDDRNASKHLTEALNGLIAYVGEDSADVGVFAAALGQIRHRHKDYQGAAACYAMAVKRLQPSWEPSDPRLMGLRSQQAKALRQAGEFAEAARLDAVSMRIEVSAALKKKDSTPLR